MSSRIHTLVRLRRSSKSVASVAVGLSLSLASAYASADVQGPLTDDFRAWLRANGYGGYGFERSDVTGGSFGGKSPVAPSVERDPVIFVHGGGGQALGGATGGWTLPLASYVAAGYEESELYGTTYGDPSGVITNLVNSPALIDYVASFVSAVLAYTGKEKVNIVAHSFGVTLSRGALRSRGLGARVKTFIAIAGANLGAPVTSHCAI